MHVGTMPPRPSPVRKRRKPKTSADGENAVSSMQVENHAIQASMILRRPSLSVRMPTESVPTSMPTKARLPISPACAGVTPHSWNLRIVGTVDP